MYKYGNLIRLVQVKKCDAEYEHEPLFLREGRKEGGSELINKPLVINKIKQARRTAIF
jgi:hypothetical protein